MIPENKETEFVELTTCWRCCEIVIKDEGFTYKRIKELDVGKIGRETIHSCCPKCFIEEMKFSIDDELIMFAGMHKEFIENFLSYFKFDEFGEMINSNKKDEDDKHEKR